MIEAVRTASTRLAAALAVATLASGAAAAEAGAAYFSNFNDPAADMNIPSVGPAERYPSLVPVAGIPKPVLRVRLVDFSFLHLNPEDMDVLLVAPSGEVSALMSDACGEQDAIEDDGVLTFADSAAQHLPMASCRAGTFKPTNYQVDASLPPPAPPITGFGYPASLSEFSGATANGNWELYVYDDGFTESICGGCGVGAGFGVDINVKASCRGRAANLTGANGRGDFIGGKRGRDVIVGFGGSDLLFGKRGRDFICGNRGSDDIFGGRGRDVLVGAGGRDRLVGGPGNDLCIGGPGRDRLKDC